MSAAWLQRLRLWTGLVLVLFLTTHLLNHSLGNISLEAMEWGRRLFLGLWRHPVGSILLYGAVVLHMLVVILALLRRRRLAMPPGEAVQIVFGLAIPLFLASHVTATRGASQFHGLEDSYAFVLLSIWLWDWQQGLLQTVATLVAWTHGCLGLHYWLRLKPNYDNWSGPLLALAVLLPAAALAGFAAGAKEAALLAADSLWLQRQLQIIGLPNPEAVDWIHARAAAVRIGTFAVVLGIVAFRFARHLHERRHTITVTYPDGRRASVDAGHTVLEASRAAGIPHASVCGGRGRCSTCRVRVLTGAADLPPPGEQEVKVLSRVGAPAGVRLACQLRPGRDVAVVPLLPVTAEPRDGFRKPGYHQGAEREIAILFADLRAFTRFAEDKLPYDVVFVINQYFRAMGIAVEEAGGRLDKFIGDGVMALFGIDRGLEAGARRSLDAARRMALALAEINTRLSHDMGESLRMGIGIHAGACIVGEMGYREVVSMTAIGDAVNTASRLETLTKEFGCQLVVSEAVADAAGVDLGAFPKHAIQVRGRAEPLNVFVIEDATALPITPPS